ncbi:hypothetical protein [Streptomyces sp. JHA26]|uniref:hypothetical protein n=1 Tax=Streptomyces sp. JHA26 TaxID=1917143 RepID=UPI0015C56451|nr:hypothetical protein [Streptomyces sp. JHA26]
MARIPRRHVPHLTGATTLVTALALTMGPVAPAAGAPVPGGAGSDPTPASTPADTTPSPTPTSDRSGTAPPSTAPSTPTPTSDSSPSPTSGTTSDGTPGTTTPSGTDRGGAAASAALEQQQEAVDDVTAELDAKKQDIPDELAPSVDRLTDALVAVSDPRTPPQQRDGTVRSAQRVAAALDAIADPATPGAVRAQLTGLVRQVASALDAASRPGTPTEDARLRTLVVARTTSVLRLVADQDAPPDVTSDLVDTAHHLLSPRQGAAATADPSAPPSASSGAAAHESAESLHEATAVETASDPNTSDGRRKELAESAHQAGSSPPGDPGAKEKRDRMERDVKKAVQDQGLPDEPLGKAAELCTNSVFEAVPDATLAEDLRHLVPAAWDSEGVRDFWKSEEAANDTLDVYAQLRNEKIAESALAIRRMIPGLADSLPADELYHSLGLHARDCLRAAVLLDSEAGVESGNWLSAAQEV